MGYILSPVTRAKMTTQSKISGNIVNAPVFKPFFKKILDGIAPLRLGV